MTVVQESLVALAEHARISIAFTVDRVFAVIEGSPCCGIAAYKRRVLDAGGSVVGSTVSVDIAGSRPAHLDSCPRS